MTSGGDGCWSRGAGIGSGSGTEGSVDGLDRDQPSGFRGEHLEGLHGDGSCGAACGAEAAADAAGFVLEHDGAGEGAEFVGLDVVEFEAEDFARGGELCGGLGVEVDAVDGDELEAVFGTDVDASPAQDAEGAVFVGAFEDGVDPAVEAALGLGHGGGVVVSDFDFGHAGAAVEGEHGDGLTIDVEQVERHLVAVHDLDFDDGVGVFGAAEELVDADCGALAVGDTIDDEARAKDAVATSKDAWRGGHEGFGVDGNEAARGDLDAVVGGDEVELGGLADGHDDGVAVEDRLGVVEEGGVEAAVFVEDGFGLEGFEAGDVAVFADDALRAEAGVDDDAFAFCLFDLFECGGHFDAVFEADEVDFLGAEA